MSSPVSGLAETVLAAMVGDSLMFGALFAVAVVLGLGAICLTTAWTNKPRLAVSHLVPRRVHAFISQPVPEVRQASVTVSDPMIMRNDQITVSVVKPEEKPRTFERVEASSDSLITQARTLGDFPDIGAESLSMPPSPGRGHSRGMRTADQRKHCPPGANCSSACG